MKKIMILGAGAVQVPIIEKVKSLNYQSLALDLNPHAPGMKIADIAISISTNDFSKILKTAAEHKIDAILTTSDFPVNSVALVSEKLNLHAMSSKVAEICTNKFLQRDFFDNNNISHPYFRLFSLIEDVSDLKDYPYVLKPLSSSGSRGVFMVNNLAELMEKFSLVQEYSTGNAMLIEKYIGGREFSVETITQENHTTVVAITEKITKGDQFGAFVEDLHLIPARISGEEKNLIISVVKKLIDSLGLNNCPSHTELKLCDNKVYIIEIACRLGGDFITSDLVPLHNGIDMLDNLIRLSLGEKVKVDPLINKVSCIQFLNNNNYYNCKKFIEKNSRFMIKFQIDEYHSNPILNSNLRMGYIILQSDTYEQIEEILTELNQHKKKWKKI
jgi:carbamoyl-phosphate synthase large subunit